MSVHLNTSYSSYTDTGYENKKSNNSKVIKMTQEQDKTNDTALNLILAKMTSMENTMKSYEDTMKSYEGTMKSQINEIKRQGKTIDTLNTKVDSLTEEVSELKTENANLKTEISRRDTVTFEEMASNMTPGRKILTGLKLTGQGVFEGSVDIVTTIATTRLTRRLNSLGN